MKIIRLVWYGLEFVGLGFLSMVQVRYPRPFQRWRERMKKEKLRVKAKKMEGIPLKLKPGWEVVQRPGQAQPQDRTTVAKTKPSMPQPPPKVILEGSGGSQDLKDTGSIDGPGDIKSLPGLPKVSPEVAGKTLKLVGKIASVAVPGFRPLEPDEIEGLQEDLAFVMEDMGFRADERRGHYFFFFAGVAGIVIKRLPDIAKAKKKVSPSGSTDSKAGDSREGGDGKDDAGKVAGPSA